MLWTAQKAGVDKRTLTLAKALCAKTVIHLMKDKRSRHAVAVAEAYGRGEATEDELRAAATAAYAAAYADAAAIAAYAAAAVVYTYAYAAADAAYDDDARTKNRKDTADICREVLTDAVFAKINGPQVVEGG